MSCRRTGTPWSGPCHGPVSPRKNCRTVATLFWRAQRWSSGAGVVVQCGTERNSERNRDTHHRSGIPTVPPFHRSTVRTRAMPPESFLRHPMPGINRSIYPHLNIGFKWRKIFVLADFSLLFGAGPESAKSGLELGGRPTGEVRNLSHEPPTTRRSHRIQTIKNPNADPLGFLNWWWGGGLHQTPSTQVLRGGDSCCGNSPNGGPARPSLRQCAAAFGGRQGIKIDSPFDSQKRNRTRVRQIANFHSHNRPTVCVRPCLSRVSRYS